MLGRICQLYKVGFLRIFCYSKEAVEGNRSCNLWMKEFQRYRNVSELNRQMITSLVDKIMVYNDGSMEVVFRYANEIALLLEKIRNYQGNEEITELAMAGKAQLLRGRNLTV